MSNTVSNWNHWVESMPYTPQEFFQAIQEKLQTMQIEEVKIELITHHAGKLGKRLYLRIKHLKTSIDVGAAPYGNGFFVSYWVTKRESGSVVANIYRGLAKLFGYLPLPFIPQIFYRILNNWADAAEKAHQTFYTYDDLYMFQQAVHRAIMYVINDASATQGKRQMPEYVTSPHFMINA